MCPAVLNTYKCYRYRKCIRCYIPMHEIIVYLLCFLPALYRSTFTSRTPNKDQKVEQLFYFPFIQVLITLRRPWTSLSSAVTGFVHAIYKCSRKVSRAYVFIALDRFPYLSMHSVTHFLLYSMSLEQSFSIEQFQTLLKLIQKINLSSTTIFT